MASQQGRADPDADLSGSRATDREYAGFKVTFVNSTATDDSNPQVRAVAKVGDKTWPCQGYDDPATGTPVYDPSDTTDHPLIIGAGKTVPVTILCRMPDDATDSSQVWLR